jgi:3-hydroxymyristoyl/3-hydroxydecanoyl-(acyl carrier protein) dehydratase
MTATLTIPPEGPLFEGHFPGRPILPGVALLALVAGALGRTAPLRGVAFARLRQPVFPGDALAIAARELAPDRLRVGVTRGQAVVAHAELEFGRLPVAGVAMPVAPDTGAAFPEALLPHRPPMRFVVGVVRDSADGLVGEARIPEACALVHAGTAPAIAVVEAAAQCAALWEALGRVRAGGAAGARVGYLVSLRDVRLHEVRVPAETGFRVHIALEEAAMPMTWYRMRVALGAREIATGAIATYLTNEPA